jgi:predicted transcriptional regulator
MTIRRPGDDVHRKQALFICIYKSLRYSIATGKPRRSRSMTGLRVVEGRGPDDRQSGAARVVVQGISLRQSGMKLTYEGWDLVLHVVTPERLALLRTVRQHQPVSALRLAGILKRGSRDVLVDVRLLLDAHLLGGSEDCLQMEYERLSFSLDL